MMSFNLFSSMLIFMSSEAYHLFWCNSPASHYFVICCRLSVHRLTAEGEACDCEVADGGVGMDGSVKRHRAYRRKVY